MATQTGSIDLKAAKEAAGSATNYITFIDNTNGIRVFDGQAANKDVNFAQVNSQGMQVYKGGTSSAYQVAQFGETTRIGKEAEGHVKVTSDGIELWGQMQGETDHTFIYSEGIQVGANADQGSIGLGPGGYVEGYYNEIDENVTENGLRIEANTVNEEEGSSTQAIVRIGACGADTAAVINAFIDDSIDNGDGTVGISSVNIAADRLDIDAPMYYRDRLMPVIYASTIAPTASDGQNGDIWLVY